MAQIIEVNSGLALGHVFSPPQNPNNHAFLLNYYDNLSTSLGAVANNAISAARKVFESAYDMGLRAKAMLTNLVNKSSFHPNMIVRLDTLEEIKQASPVMQRYIMSDPYIRERYLDQQCSGYVDTYVNVFGDLTGKLHYDFRIANDGLILENDEGMYVSEHFYHDLMEGDRELTHQEKVNIKLTTMTARAFMEDGQDPTEVL